MSGLPAIETFDCEGEPCVEGPKKKRAMLLHSGGLPLQKIYHSIPGAHVDEPQDDNDVFFVAVQKLDEYFKPK
ncbi:unnamed protein product [Acanthoscelides obtectus]|uniref:Uncharacterized protein n=1 Tax=Acanthoscelides obtectus TaxID=200917 RepID=A0A9P0KES9_ACAOB|nr:unnamed protein product [Acanthoscelides obtectus]CAK1680374.1 hypothetical protein AOBTE_LOCUS32603 [Acanthoscelides obtectus]